MHRHESTQEAMQRRDRPGPRLTLARDGISFILLLTGWSRPPCTKVPMPESLTSARPQHAAAETPAELHCPLTGLSDAPQTTAQVQNRLPAPKPQIHRLPLEERSSQTHRHHLKGRQKHHRLGRRRKHLCHL